MIQTDQTVPDEVAVIPGVPVARVEVARVEAVPVLTGLNQAVMPVAVPVVVGRVLGVQARTARVHPVAIARIVEIVLTVVAVRAVVAQTVEIGLTVVAEVVNRGMSGRANPVRPAMTRQTRLFFRRSCPMSPLTS